LTYKQRNKAFLIWERATSAPGCGTERGNETTLDGVERNVLINKDADELKKGLACWGREEQNSMGCL